MAAGGVIMAFSTKKLLTIITEGVLEKNLVDDIQRLGAHGYTITDARGGGAHGEQSGRWSQDCNIRLEVVCDAPIAETIATHLQQRYYRHYAMILFVSDVSVLRPEKF
jgi:hypothetical protein